MAVAAGALLGHRATPPGPLGLRISLEADKGEGRSMCEGSAMVRVRVRLIDGLGSGLGLSLEAARCPYAGY